MCLLLLVTRAPKSGEKRWRLQKIEKVIISTERALAMLLPAFAAGCYFLSRTREPSGELLEAEVLEF